MDPSRFIPHDHIRCSSLGMHEYVTSCKQIVIKSSCPVLKPFVATFIRRSYKNLHTIRLVLLNTAVNTSRPVHYSTAVYPKLTSGRPLPVAYSSRSVSQSTSSG